MIAFLPLTLKDLLDVRANFGPTKELFSDRLRSMLTSSFKPLGFLKSTLAPVPAVLQVTAVPSLRDHVRVILLLPVRVRVFVTAPLFDVSDAMLKSVQTHLNDTANLLTAKGFKVVRAPLPLTILYRELSQDEGARLPLVRENSELLDSVRSGRT